MEDDIYGNPDQAFADQIAADDANKTFAQKFREARAQGKGTVFYWKGKPVAAYLKGEEPASWTKSAAPSRSPQAAAPSAPSTQARDPGNYFGPSYPGNYFGPSAMQRQLRASADSDVIGPDQYESRADMEARMQAMRDEEKARYDQVTGGLSASMMGPTAVGGATGAALYAAGAAGAGTVAGYLERRAAQQLAKRQVAQRLGSGSSNLNARLADVSRRGAERAATSPTRKAMGSATRSTAEEGSSVVVKPRGMTPKTTTGETTSTTPIRPRGMTPKSTQSPSAAPRPTKGMTPKSDTAPTAPRRVKGMTPKSDTAPSPARPVRGMNPKNRAPDDATDDIREVVRRKGLGYAKGGSVRGAGIERRGRTKGRFVR